MEPRIMDHVGRIRTFIIEDIHPDDSTHERRERLVGTKIVSRDMRLSDLFPGYYTGPAITTDTPWPKKYFLAVKLKEVEE